MRVFFVLLLAALFGTTVSAQEKEAAAQGAALEWLVHVDAGDYVTSWNEAAIFFKEQITAQAWRNAASKARRPFGALRARQIKSARYATSLPGAPDGEYVVLQFDTEFENKAAGVETITTVLENGAWRVTGYFVK